MQNNLERIKPFYKIDVKVKTKYKTYLSNLCEITSSYINFQGVEIEEDAIVTSLEEANAFLEKNAKVNMYYPWSSIVSITLNRFLKKE